MKKGLRQPLIAVLQRIVVCLNHCPDEEGIKTKKIFIHPLFDCLNHCPDEEGIKTGSH